MTVAVLERFGPDGRDLVMLDEARPRISIGTSSENDLVLDGDPTVSRVHAVLEPVGPAWCITDLGSTNGTLVNGERIFAARSLRDGDELIFGRTRCVLRDRSVSTGATTQRIAPAPPRTPGEQRVLVALCRPVLSGKVFTQPASTRDVAESLFVTQSAVKQHLDHLYDKFGILDGEERRVRLANEAIQRGAVTYRDLREDASAGGDPPP